MSLHRWSLVAATVLALGAATAPVRAQQPAALRAADTVPVEDFVRRAQFSTYVVSPDGNKMAALVPINGRDNLAVIDLVKRSRTNITNFDKYDATDIRWITNDRLWFRTVEGRDVDSRANYHGSYTINVDGSDIKQMDRLRGTPVRPRLLQVVDRKTGDMIIETALRRREAVDLYLVNSQNSTVELLTFDSPAYTSKFLLDDKNVARFAWASPDPRKSRDVELWYRATGDAKWEKVQVWQEGGEYWEPVSIEPDGKRAIVRSNVGRDKKAYYWYDLDARKMGELIVEHPMIDLGEEADFIADGVSPIIRASDPNKPNEPARIVGTFTNADKPEVKWLDPELARIQAMIDAALPGRFNRFATTVLLGRKTVVRSSSPNEPVRNYLFDPEKKSIEELPQSRPWLANVAMPQRSHLSYNARDGLPIQAFLTVPQASAGKKLPLIVHIHGGPYLRDYGLMPTRVDAQVFASRGYAVLEPEPRGSKGFGRKHFKAGWGTWGQEMQNDITDGVKALVDKGVVDPDRVCLYGGSYGGYATLQGLVREPDMFKCGLATVAVTDLELFQETTWSDIPVQYDSMQQWFDERVGNPKRDQAKLAANSPLRNASKIKAPVMLVMGEADDRVPLVHGDKMRDALKAAGVPLDYHVYVGEGHGWRKESNRFDFYNRALAFFDKHLKR